MSRYWWKWLLIGMTTTLLVCTFDCAGPMSWVGRTDLTVEFAITDAATAAPVPGARVEIQQGQGGFYEDQDEKKFTLISAVDGLATKECRGSMCFGTRSGLRFTDTFVVHLPHWRFRVVADGYEPGKCTELNVLEHIQQARRDGPGKAKLVVPVALQKSHADP